MKKTMIFLVTMLMLCSAFSVAGTTLATGNDYAETEYHWYQDLGGVFSVTDITGLSSTVDRGEILNIYFKITIGQDSVEHLVTPVFASNDRQTVIVQFEPKVKDNNGAGYTEGTKINSHITNMDTFFIPDEFCDEYIQVGAIHQLLIDGQWEADPVNGNYNDADYPYSAKFFLTCGDLPEEGSELGEACGANDDCANDMCIAYECSDELRDIDDFCFADTDCTSNTCYRTQCVDDTPVEPEDEVNDSEEPEDPIIGEECTIGQLKIGTCTNGQQYQIDCIDDVWTSPEALDAICAFSCEGDECNVASLVCDNVDRSCDGLCEECTLWDKFVTFLKNLLQGESV